MDGHKIYSRNMQVWLHKTEYYRCFPYMNNYSIIEVTNDIITNISALVK